MIDDSGGTELTDTITLIAKTISDEANSLKNTLADSFKINPIDVHFRISKESKNEIDTWLSSREISVYIDVLNRGEINDIINDIVNGVNYKKIPIEVGAINATLTDDALNSIKTSIEKLIPEIEEVKVKKVQAGEVTVNARFSKDQIQTALNNLSEKDVETGDKKPFVFVPLGVNDYSILTINSLRSAVLSLNERIRKDNSGEFVVKLDAIVGDGKFSDISKATSKITEYNKALADFYNFYNQAEGAAKKNFPTVDKVKEIPKIMQAIRDLDSYDFQANAAAIVGEIMSYTQEHPIEMMVVFDTTRQYIKESVEGAGGIQEKINQYFEAEGKPKVKVALDISDKKALKAVQDGVTNIDWEGIKTIWNNRAMSFGNDLNPIKVRAVAVPNFDKVKEYDGQTIDEVEVGFNFKPVFGPKTVKNLERAWNQATANSQLYIHPSLMFNDYDLDNLVWIANNYLSDKPVYIHPDIHPDAVMPLDNVINFVTRSFEAAQEEIQSTDLYSHMFGINWNDIKDVWNNRAASFGNDLTPIKVRVNPDISKILELNENPPDVKVNAHITADLSEINKTEIETSWMKYSRNWHFRIYPTANLSYISELNIKDRLSEIIERKQFEVKAKILANNVKVDTKAIKSAFDSAVAELKNSDPEALTIHPYVSYADLIQFTDDPLQVAIKPIAMPSDRDELLKDTEKMPYSVYVSPIMMRSVWNKKILDPNKDKGYRTPIAPVLTQAMWDTNTWMKIKEGGYVTSVIPKLTKTMWNKTLKDKVYKVVASVDTNKTSVQQIFNKVKKYFNDNEIPIKFTIENNKIKGAIQVVDKDGNPTGETVDSDGNKAQKPKKTKGINFEELEQMADYSERLKDLLQKIKDEKNPQVQKKLASLFKTEFGKDVRENFEDALGLKRGDLGSILSDVDKVDMGPELLKRIDVLKKQADGVVRENIDNLLDAINDANIISEEMAANGLKDEERIFKDLAENLAGGAYSYLLKYLAEKFKNGLPGQPNSANVRELREFAEYLPDGPMKDSILEQIDILGVTPEGVGSKKLQAEISKGLSNIIHNLFHQKYLENINIDDIRSEYTSRIANMSDDIKEKKEIISILNLLDKVDINDIENVITTLNQLIKSGWRAQAQADAGVVNHNKGSPQNQAKYKEPINIETESWMLDEVFKKEGFSDRYKRMMEFLDRMVSSKSKGTIDKDLFYKEYNAAFDNTKTKEQIINEHIDSMMNDLDELVKKNAAKFQSYKDWFNNETDYEQKKKAYATAMNLDTADKRETAKFPYAKAQAQEIIDKYNEIFEGHFNAAAEELKLAKTIKDINKIMSSVEYQYRSMVNKFSYGQSDFKKKEMDERMQAIYNAAPDQYRRAWLAYNNTEDFNEKKDILTEALRSYKKDNIKTLIGEDKNQVMKEQLEGAMSVMYPELKKYVEAYNVAPDDKARKEVYDKAVRFADAIDEMIEKVNEFPELKKLLADFRAAPSESYRKAVKREFDKEYNKKVREQVNPKDTFSYKFKDYFRKQIPSLIGRGAKGIFNLFGNVFTKIKDIFVKIMKKAIDISIKPFTKSVKMFSNAVKKAGGQSKVLSSISELLITPLVLAVEYTLLPVLIKLIPHIKEVIDWVVKSKDKFTLLGKGISNVVTSLYKMVTGNFILGFEKFFQKLQDYKDPIESFYDKFTTLFQDLKEKGITLDNLSENIVGFGEVVKNINDAFKDFGRNEDGQLTFIADFATTMATSIGETVSTALEGIKSYLSGEEIKESMKTLMSEVISYVLTNFQITSEMIVGILESFRSAINEVLADESTQGKLQRVTTAIQDIISGILGIAKDVISDGKVQQAIWNMIWAALPIWGPIVGAKVLGGFAQKGAEGLAGWGIGKMSKTGTGKIPGTTGGIAGGLGGAGTAGASGLAAFGTKIKDGLASIKNSVLNIFGKGVKPVAASNTVKSPWDFAKIGEGFGAGARTAAGEGASWLTKALPIISGLGSVLTAGITALGVYTQKANVGDMFLTSEVIEDVLAGNRQRFAAGEDLMFGGYDPRELTPSGESYSKLLDELNKNYDKYTTTNGFFEWISGEKYLDINVPELQELLKEYGYDSELNTTANNIYNKIPDTEQNPTVNFTSNTDITVKVDKNGDVTTESRTWFDDVADWFNSIVRVNAGTGA